LAIKKVMTKSGPRWEVDYRDPEYRRLRRRFDRKKDADAFEATVRTAKRTGKFKEIFGEDKTKSPLFLEAMKDYLEISRGQKSFSSFKGYIINMLLNYFGNKPLDKITYRDVETFKNRRKLTPTKNGTARSDAQVNRELAVLKHFLNKCMEWDFLSVSPFKRGRSLMSKENNQRSRFLTDEEAQNLLEECKAIRPIVKAALLTGMRSNEILTLRWEQVHHGQIHLKANETKSKKARQIPICDDLAELFAELRQINQLRSPYVFIQPNGERYLSVRNAFENACQRAGIYDFHFHDLRHTFASHLVMTGVDLASVQKILGHSDIKMTMRYAHLAPGHLQEAVNKLNGFGRCRKNDGLFLDTKPGTGTLPDAVTN
jgi:integrase